MKTTFARGFWKALFKSATEIVFSLFVANFWFFMLIFVQLVNTPDLKLSTGLFAKTAESNISASDALVYLLALLAPTLWIMVSNWRARKHTSFYLVLLMFQGMVICFASYIYAQGRFAEIANKEFATQFAIAAFIACITTWLIALMYNHFLPATISMAPMQSGARVLADLEERT